MRESQTPTHMRPEGRILSLRQLTRHQRTAVRRILDALAETEKSKDKDSKNRRSQLYFLHGTRGTGKSSVIASLKDQFDEQDSAWVNEPIEAPHVEDAGVKEAMADFERIRIHLKALKNHVFWLDWIDMDPLPTSTHLLAAVLTRLEVRALRCLGGRRVEHEGVDDPVFRFRQIQVDAAEAWEGNVREKALTTDLEVHAGDVLRAERKKLELNDKLVKRIDDLCDKVFNRKNALFVLPVDDFDLNPSRTVELIKLIRKLALPRLFTVVLGDIDVAEHVFYLSTRGDLVRNGSLEYAGDTRDTDLVAGESAAGAMRKLLPPEQTLRLDAFTLPEALEHRPFEGRDSLRESLDNVPVWYELPGSGSAHDFLPLTDLLLGPSGAVVGRSSILSSYPGAELLRTSPRHLTDLWMALNNLPSHPTVKDLLDEATAKAKNDKDRGKDASTQTQQDDRDRPMQDAVTMLAVRLFQQAVAEDGGLTVDERRVCRNAVRKNDMSGEWELDTTPFEIRSRLSTPLMLRLQPGLDVAAHRLVGWDGSVPRDDGASQTSPTLQASPNSAPLAVFSRRLSNQTIGALSLLHDLLLLQERGSLPVAVIDRAIALRAYARWNLGSTQLHIPWFSDVWGTFWETAMFADTWNQVEEKARKIARDPGWMNYDDITMYLMCGWVLAGLCVLTGPRSNKEVQDIKGEFLTTQFDDRAETKQEAPKRKIIIFANDKLMKAISSEVNRLKDWLKERIDNRITEKYVAWLVATGCLFTPECGCLAGSSSPWFEFIEALHKQVTGVGSDEANAPSSKASHIIEKIKDEWNTRITSRIVERRVSHLFGKPEKYGPQTWFISPKLAQEIDAHPPFEGQRFDEEVFFKHPANGGQYADRIEQTIKLTVRQPVSAESLQNRYTMSPPRVPGSSPAK